MDLLDYFKSHDFAGRNNARRFFGFNWHDFVVLMRQYLPEPANHAADGQYGAKNADRDVRQHAHERQRCSQGQAEGPRGRLGHEHAPRLGTYVLWPLFAHAAIAQ